MRGTPSGVPTLAIAAGSRKVTAQGTEVGFPNQQPASGTEPADDVAEGDAGGEDVSRGPERQLVPAQVEQRHDHGGDQPA